MNHGGLIMNHGALGMKRLALTLACLLAFGCTGPTVPLSIGFPSQEAFLVTSQIDVQVVPLGDSQCAALLGNAIQGMALDTSVSSLGLVPCDVLHGTTLPDPGGGLHAFVVLGRATNGVILGGCTVGEAYPGGPPINVDLYPTSTADYGAAVMAAHLAPGSTADQRCGSTP
jgi:hypothetical protein